MLRAVKLAGLLALFTALVVCMVAAWSHRFMPADGAVRLGLNALTLAGDRPAGLSWDGDALRMTGRPERRDSAQFLIPGMEGVEFLLVRHHAVADGIVVGWDKWDDGRLFIEWLVDDEVVGISRIHSARGSSDRGVNTMVIAAPRRDAVPVLVFENLGHAGTYELRHFELVAARERRIWALGKWAFGAGILVLLVGLIADKKKPARWRGWVAAAMWLWVATNYAFPGPWDAALPFVVPFAFGEVEDFQAGSAKLELPDAVPVHGGIPQMEQLPPPGDIGLRLKLWLPWLRPLLHFVLLFAPVLAMAWFVGTKRAFWLGWSLSLMIEAAQVLYGFGFGWDDVWDLIVNGIAISVAVWMHRRFAEWIHSRLPFPFPRPF